MHTTGQQLENASACIDLVVFWLKAFASHALCRLTLFPTRFSCKYQSAMPMSALQVATRAFAKVLAALASKYDETVSVNRDSDDASFKSA